MEILHACFLQMKFPSFKCTALEGIMYCDEIAKGFCCYNEGQYAVGHFFCLTFQADQSIEVIRGKPVFCVMQNHQAVSPVTAWCCSAAPETTPCLSPMTLGKLRACFYLKMLEAFSIQG